ncbi:MAG TPA: hypothetical protein VIJ37_02930, partial [Steroidobacteraceae bacterium]
MALSDVAGTDFRGVVVGGIVRAVKARVGGPMCQCLKRAALFLLAGACATFLLSETVSAQEYVTNGGFESGLTGWVSNDFIADAGAGHNSSKFALGPNSGTSASLSQTTAALLAGRYIFSFWYRTFPNQIDVNVTASIGGTQVFSTTTNITSYAEFSQNVTLSGTNTISFTADSSGNVLFLDDVSLLYLNLLSQLPAAARPTNPSNVAFAIDSSTGALPTGFNGLYSLTGNTLSVALGQLSGEPGASVAQTGITAINQFVGAIFDTFVSETDAGTPFSAASAYAPQKKVSREAQDAYAAMTPRDALAPVSRWSVWASGYGGSQRIDG